MEVKGGEAQGRHREMGSDCGVGGASRRLLPLPDTGDATAGGAFGYANLSRRYDIHAKAGGVPADRKGKST
jgi:hypothetical protein